jgi:serine/threonine protein phosphatase PrpC
MDDDDDEPRTGVTQPVTVVPRIAFEAVQPLSSLITVEFAAHSHPGGRSANEDHYLALRLGRHQETLASSLRHGEVPDRFDEAGFGMVVADGMGVSGAGETASRLAIATLAHLVLRFGTWNVRIDDRAAADVLARAERFYHRIDQTVTEAGYAHPALSGMSTTLTAAYIAGDSLFIAHVGHSRVYLFRDGQLKQSTRDQTLAQRLVETEPPAPIELAARDLRHILTDAIGGRTGSPAAEIEQVKLQHGDSVLLCTNGLTDVVDDEALAAILGQTSTLDQQCLSLVELALARGSADNITVVMAKYRVSEPAG